MKKSTAILTTMAAMAGPALATAQVTNHVSYGIGVTGYHYPDYRPGVRPVLLRAPAVEAFRVRRGLSFGVGFGVGFGFSHDSYGYGHGGHLYDYYGFDALDLHHCLDYWHDPYCGCGPYHSHYRSGWYGSWYGPVFFTAGPRFRFGWHASGPYWNDPYYHQWGYGGWDPYRDWGYRGYRTVYVDYYRDYGYTRVATRSPLFGPRYKEDPRPAVYVTDNGPERPVSRAVPRSDRTEQLEGIASRRPSARRGGASVRAEPSTRTARPRVRARPETGSNANPSTTARPRTRTGEAVRRGPTQTTRPDPRSDERRKAGTTVRVPAGRSDAPVVGTRPQPTPRVRSAPTRKSGPSTRSAPVRSARPTVRSNPRTRSTPPQVRSAPRTRSTPAKARSAPKTRSTPAKARSAPKTRSTPAKTRSAPRTRSAPPKARSAPPKRSPPKSSPPRRRGK